MKQGIVLACLGTVMLSMTVRAEDNRQRWHASFDSAQTEALKSGKPIFLVFR